MSTETPEDQPYRHFSTKQRVVAWVSRNLLDNVTYTVRHGLLKGMKRRGGLGWLPEIITGSTKSPELSFWMNQDLRNLVIYDIGAFHGLLTLFFARHGKQVISYEPNAANYARLNENLRINSVTNVLVRKVGVGSKREIATMVGSPLMSGGARVERSAGARVSHKDSGLVSEQISVTTIDDDIEEMSLPAPDLLKIDVEGEELAVLTGARETLLCRRPRLFIEMHGDTMNMKRKKVAALVNYLNELGYIEIFHVESGERIHSDNSALAAEGHLYCK